MAKEWTCSYKSISERYQIKLDDTDFVSYLTLAVCQHELVKMLDLKLIAGLSKGQAKREAAWGITAISQVD